MATKKASKEPLVRCNGTMTESAWLAWVRSALRSKSLRWPPRGEALKLARRKYVGTNKMQKWEYQCALCSEWQLAKNCNVDHHPVAAGSILSVQDIGNFANNLFCETDNLRVLCSDCHKVHTLSEKKGISFIEAAIEKQVIEKCKLPIPKQVALLSGYGYNACSNAAKRKAAWREIINKESVCIK